MLLREQVDGCIRHPDFWLVDGSVVLQAKDTLFRVHSSKLAPIAPLFESLIAGDGRRANGQSPSLNTARKQAPGREATCRFKGEVVESCPVYFSYEHLARRFRKFVVHPGQRLVSLMLSTE